MLFKKDSVNIEKWKTRLSARRITLDEVLFLTNLALFKMLYTLAVLLKGVSTGTLNTSFPHPLEDYTRILNNIKFYEQNIAYTQPPNFCFWQCK